MEPVDEKLGSAQSTRMVQAGPLGPAARTVFEYYRQFGVDEKTLRQMYGCQCLEVYEPKPGPSLSSLKAARIVRR